MTLSRLFRLGIAAGLLAMTVVFVAVAALAFATFVPGSDGSTAEAGGMWFAWLFNPQDDSFLRVYEDGSTEQHTVTLPAGLRVSASPTAFAPNGELIALCARDDSGSATYLIVHSFNPDAVSKAGISFPVVYALGQRTECSIPQNAFNESDPNQLAFGVVNHYPGDPNADLSRPAWELLVFDIAQATITARYDATTPGAENIVPFDGARWVFMPYVHRFVDGTVYFELAPWGTEFMPGQKVVSWQPGAQVVTPVSGPLGQMGLQTHPVTQEMVWLGIDESLPQAQPMGPMPAYNVVLYQHPSMAAPVAIYHDPTVIPGQLEYVRGGDALAILAIPGADMSADIPEPGPSDWVLLERSGAVTPLNLGAFVYHIAGLRDGLAAWESNYENWTATLYRYTWAEGAASPAQSVLWSGDNPNWTLMWAMPQPTGGDVQMFQPFVR